MRDPLVEEAQKILAQARMKEGEPPSDHPLKKREAIPGEARVAAKNDRSVGSGTTFADLGLSDDILSAVADAGYTEPTPIQVRAIPYILMNRDVLGSAQTGTGKTASFTLPMIDVLAQGRARARMPRSLVLEPTRELAAQVAENFVTYGKHHRLTHALLTGGESLDGQRRSLDRGVDVLIATPGRLLDWAERGGVLLHDIKILVIDEADRLLDMGFMPDVERIVSLLPKVRQTLFFSATLTPEIRHLAASFLANPKEIWVDPPAQPAEMVIQGLAVVAPGKKREALRRLLEGEDVESALIFCNRKRDVDVLARSLDRAGLRAAALHGDMPQPKRTATLEAFRRREVRYLVASDVAGRGLDIEDLSHVVNFDVPIHPETYVHRIGRTGRAGKSGKAFTLAAPAEADLVRAIERLIGAEIPRVEIAGAARAAPAREGESTKPPESARKRAGRRGRRKPATPADSARKAKAAASPPPEKTGKDSRRRAGGEGRPAQASAMGGHVPAFLLRPPQGGGR